MSHVLQDFMPKLKDHILARFQGIAYDGEQQAFTDEDHDGIKFVSNRIYRHKVLRVNYTTYDMRRAQDSINLRTHPDIMVLAHEDDDNEKMETHPYWYARVVGIFYVNVRHTGPTSRSTEVHRMEFLWVRWLALDSDHQGGFRTRRLHRVGFLSGDDPNAFGFLDPVLVVHAVHLIPAFTFGRTDEIMGPSIVQSEDDGDEDWSFLHVNM